MAHYPTEMAAPNDNRKTAPGWCTLGQGVVVAPTAAPNRVVRLVLLNLALSFAQAHTSAPFGRRPRRYIKQNVYKYYIRGEVFRCSTDSCHGEKIPTVRACHQRVRTPPRRENPAMRPTEKPPSRRRVKERITCGKESCTS